MLVFLKFLVCAFLIFFAGSRLSKYGDVIAEKSGLGHAWIGLVVLAAVTSLPEMFNGISAVAFVGAPDLAVGNIMGACLINMAVIGALDIYQFFRKKPFVFARISPSNRVSVISGILLTAVVLFGIFVSQRVFDFTLLGVSFYSVLIFILYLLTQRLVFMAAVSRDRSDDVIKYPHIEINHVYLKFAFFALIIIGAGIWLPYIGDEMASTFGLGKSFIGVFFLGIATTLPELVVSVTALKYSVDMSVGNLLGSNIFNLSLLFVDDIFYRPGSLFKAVSSGQFIVGLFLIASFLLVSFALKTKTKNRLVSVGLIVSYVVGIATVYFLR